MPKAGTPNHRRFTLQAALTATLLAIATPAGGQVYRWDNKQLIPGTENIPPLPGANYAGLTMQYASLAWKDLTGTTFASADLTHATLWNMGLASADLSGANLTSAYLASSTMTSADLTDAIVGRANFGDTTSRGFTAGQLYSTASYKARDLRGIRLSYNNLSGWNFASQDLTGADLLTSTMTSARLSRANLTSAGLWSATLTSADFTDALVRGAGFGSTTSLGFTAAQLYSTGSYKARDLREVQLHRNDLSGWDFSSQDLTSAQLWSSTLTSANLTDAIVQGADFAGATASGLTSAQFYSTASYKARDLRGIRMRSNNMAGWDLSSQDLTKAYLPYAVLTSVNLSEANLTSAYLHGAILQSANFSLADLRAATFIPITTNSLRNTIHPNGSIYGLNLLADDSLTIRDNPAVAARITTAFTAAPTSTLRILLADPVFNPTLVSVTPQLAGQLQIALIPGLSPATLLNTPIDLFNWLAPLNPGNAFASVPPLDTRYGWDTQNLYTTGEVTLRLLGDTNLDGQVTAADAALIQLGTPNPTFTTGDFNNDNQVDADDLSLFDYALATSVASPNPALPEPALLTLLPAALALRRRRR